MKYYTKSHEWVEVDGDEAVVGISQHAADTLGDLTYVELPEIGKDAVQEDALGTLESVKAASDFFAPISGTVKEVNTAVDEDPGLVNKDAEGEGWLVRLEHVDESELSTLMDADAYAEFAANEE